MAHRIKPKNKWILLLCPLTIFAVFCGIFLPGFLLNKNGETSLNHQSTAPMEYYSGVSSAVARNASSQLSLNQRMKLITGLWESEDSAASLNESAISDYEAVSLAKDGLKKLYEGGLYPYSLTDNYGNWYSWNTAFYKSVDSTFHTYTVYYWVIYFTRYDNSETHTVLMTEDGNILFASAHTNKKIQGVEDDEFKIFGNISAIYPSDHREYSAYSLISRSNISDMVEHITPYPHINVNSLTYDAVTCLVMGRSDVNTIGDFKELAQEESTNNLEYYLVYQAHMDYDYAIGIVPYSY